MSGKRDRCDAPRLCACVEARSSWSFVRGSRGLGSAGTETVAERDGGMDCSIEALAEGLLYLLERYDADPVPLDDSVRSEWRM